MSAIHCPVREILFRNYLSLIRFLSCSCDFVGILYYHVVTSGRRRRQEGRRRGKEAEAVRGGKGPGREDGQAKGGGRADQEVRGQ